MPKPKKTKAKNNRNNQSLLIIVLVVLVGFLVGTLFGIYLNSENKSVKVWAADNSVKVPQDLKSHLIKSSKDDCNEYAGDGSPNGAVLFAVTKVEDDFAKMTYGCASYLTDMEIVAIKRDGSWSLIQPADYYQTKPNYDGPALPTCSALEKYKINKDLEPECLDSKFEIRQNSNQ